MFVCVVPVACIVWLWPICELRPSCLWCALWGVVFRVSGVPVVFVLLCYVLWSSGPSIVGCRGVGLLGYQVIGLSGCWVIGISDYWIIGLLDYFDLFKGVRQDFYS